MGSIMVAELGALGSGGGGGLFYRNILPPGIFQDSIPGFPLKIEDINNRMFHYNILNGLIVGLWGRVR